MTKGKSSDFQNTYRFQSKHLEHITPNKEENNQFQVRRLHVSTHFRKGFTLKFNIFKIAFKTVYGVCVKGMQSKSFGEEQFSLMFICVCACGQIAVLSAVYIGMPVSVLFIIYML